MLSIRSEGQFIPLGLSIQLVTNSWYSFGFVLHWCWFDAPNHEFTGWRLRLRLGGKPKIMFQKQRFNPVDNWLSSNWKVVISIEEYEDAVIPYRKREAYLKAKADLIKPDYGPG